MSTLGVTIFLDVGVMWLPAYNLDFAKKKIGASNAKNRASTWPVYSNGWNRHIDRKRDYLNFSIEK